MTARIGLVSPARDGIALATDVYLPDGPGPWPVVFTRTPYARRGAAGSAARYTTDGFALVVQDCRGRYDSEGVFAPLEQEAADGQDALDWIGNQSFCDGSIAMTGKSYPGIVQLPAASGGHPALKGILPGVAPASFFNEWVRYDGCFALANMIRWPLEHASCRTIPATAHVRWPELWRVALEGSLADVESRTGISSPALRRWVEHDVEDGYWQSLDQRRLYPRLRCPALWQGGFFDHISRGQFDGFAGVRTPGQRLLAGPWGHGYCAESSHGEWDFGAHAALDIYRHEKRLLDLWLRGRDDGISEEPPVRWFLMGENRWETAATWPPAGVQTERWYLDARSGRMALGREAPSGPAAHAYTYDPRDPLPTRGGPVYWGMKEQCGLGPVDQAPILGRPDLLVYRSAPLERPLRVVGEPSCELSIAVDAPDTDVVVKLCVADPFGKVTVLTEGALRCRYREGFDRVTPLVPGEATWLRVRLAATAYAFPRGSRVVLLVTSSSFPRILPNPNTLAPTWRERAPARARVEILHTAGHESALLLPVLPA